MAGSFFDPLPKADAYFLSAILHDWNDCDAGRILRRCAEGVASGGRVVIRELLVDAADQRSAGGMDLLMLILVGGRERTLDEFNALASDAGLVLHTVVPMPTGHSLLDYRPAG